MNITIGIPTYNRRYILEIMAKSLYESDLSLKPNIRIYDDASSEFDESYLKTIFPSANSIHINRNNVRADTNMFLMYEDFMSTDDDYFFNADSDLIFHPKWLEIAIELINQTDGILSLFNTASHDIHKDLNDKLIIKRSIGAAGTLFTRQNISLFMNSFNINNAESSFDWKWSELCSKQNIGLYCVKNSLVQHIGFDGQNSKLYFDVGENFTITSKHQGQIINDIFVKTVVKNKKLEKERISKEAMFNIKRANDLSFHLRRSIIIIIKFIIPSNWAKIKRK